MSGSEEGSGGYRPRRGALAPIASLAGWPTQDEARPDDILWPYLIAGQRVAFCAAPDPKRTEIRMRYYGRVVTPGTFAWEPATA